MMNLGMAMFTGDRLVHLAPVDLVIVVFYFVLVLAIGFYLKGAQTPAKISSSPGAK